MLYEPNSPLNRMPFENVHEQNGLDVEPEISVGFPPIAGFLRRFFAWIIDTLLLGGIGLVIGALFSSYLFNIGPYGRPIGLLFIIPYFGIMNSKIGRGQTVGKRIMKIAVRSKNNEPIDFGRSIIRILLLALPALFNTWAVPIFNHAVISWLISLLVFGLGGVVIYTMVFNRKTRQGIHDLLLGTYVVYLPGETIPSFSTASRIHWMVSSLWIGIVAVGSLVTLIIAPALISKSPVASMVGIYEIIQEDPRFFSVGVKDQTFYGSNGKTSRSLIVTVWYKGKIGEEENKKIIDSIVKTVLENEKNINAYDGLQVKITSAFDIGIASGNFSRWSSQSIANWRKELYPNGSPNGYLPAPMANVFTIP